MDIIKTIEADAAAAVHWVETEVVWLEDEAKTVMAWINKEAPGLAGALAALIKQGEQAAADLATYGANGLSTEIANGVDGMETFLLNLIQSSGLATNLKGELSGLNVSGAAFIQSAAQKMVSVGLVKVLSGLASVAAKVI